MSLPQRYVGDVLQAAHAFLDAADISSLRSAVEAHTAATLGTLEARLILPRTRSSVDDELAQVLDMAPMETSQPEDDTRTLLEPFYHLRQAIGDSDPEGGEAVRALLPDHSALCVGLHTAGTFYGVLAVLDDPGLRQWSPGERVALEELGSFAAQALRSEEITRDRESRDGLTGLFDQSYLRRELSRELDHPREQPLALVMLDIDHFKNINDTAGHAAGDDVLRHLGAYLTQLTRQGDIAVRYGGEEFAVLLTRADEAAALLAAERLHQTVAEAAPGEWGSWPGQVTISAGVASLGPEQISQQLAQHAEDPEIQQAAAALTSAKRLIEQADRALYQAKRSGRNRVCRSSQLPE